MSESTKRSLRVRRPPGYLNPDVSQLNIKNEQPQQTGYGRTSYIKQFISPAQELNQFAKLLSKFINTVNKRYNQHTKNEEAIGKASKNEVGSVPQNLQKKVEIMKQGGKKKLSTKQQSKNEGHRQQKNIQDPKEHTVNKQMGKSTEINRQKGQRNQSQKKPSSMNTSGGVINSKYLNMINVINQHKTKPYPHLQASQMSQIATQQQLLLNSRLNTKKKVIKVEESESNLEADKDKLFGKAAYHLAIAYHIHFKLLLEKNIDINVPHLVDPTFKARMLKGDTQQGVKPAKK